MTTLQSQVKYIFEKLVPSKNAQYSFQLGSINAKDV